MVQDAAAVERLLAHRHEAFRAERTSSGAILIPKHRLVVCTMPKAGCTTTKWLILRLLGNLPSAEHICNPSAAGHTDAPSELWHGSHDCSDCSRWILDAWRGANMLRDATNATIRNALLSKEWTTVAVVRDPWTRAISSFQDQINRKHVAYSSATRDNFLTFTTRHEGYGHHTGAAVGFCGLSFLRYDYLVDVEDLEGGFGPVLRANPRLPDRAFRSGWEKCMPDGNPSLLAVQGQLSNSDSRVGESKEAKARRNNAIYCNKSTADAVAKRFAKDYRMLAAQGFVYRRCDVGTAAPRR